MQPPTFYQQPWHGPMPQHWNNTCLHHGMYRGWYPYFPHYPQQDWQQNPYLYRESVPIKDYGPNPFVVNIEAVTKQNNNFRIALWTGSHLQLTLMSINVNEDIGLEIHPDTDQFLRIEQGHGMVKMGPSKDKLNFQRTFNENDVILVPAGTWHNVINTGHIPLKLYSIYAPPHHPFGTVHETKAAAMAAEEMH